MTLERVEAAISKLERLRSESTQPTDGDSWYQGRQGRRYESMGEVYSGPEATTFSRDVCTGVDPVDAELIVTLHRTLDAQIEVLRSTADFFHRVGDRWTGVFEKHPEMSDALADLFRQEIALADAVLGEEK